MISDEMIARVESGTGADQTLGRAVLEACGWRKTVIGHFYGPLYYWSSPNGKIGFNDDDFYRRDPTASLDAVVSLIEAKLPGEGWQIIVHDDGGPIQAHICEAVADASSPARALLAATLRVLKENSDAP